MARFDTFVTVPDAVLAQLGAAANEHNVPIGRFASLICEAAGRLWTLDPRTTAMPTTVGMIVGASAEVPVTLNDETMARIGEAASLHRLSLGVQLRGILVAAMRGYVPPPVVRPPLSTRPKTFDPAYYARKAIIPDVPKGRPASAAAITAAVFGDPRRGL